MNHNVFIYSLVDPVSRAVRYVGKTTTPKHRLSQHRGVFKRGIRMLNLKEGTVQAPDMEILEECDGDEKVWREREKFHIAHFRSLGADLTNATSGGGPRGFQKGRAKPAVEPSSFAAQIRAERETCNLTQAEAASLLKVSKSTLEKWEAGSKVPMALTQEGALTRLRRADARGKRKEK